MVQAFRESDWRGGGHYYVGGILTLVEVLPLGVTLLREGDTHNFLRFALEGDTILRGTLFSRAE